jgi:hypothetical protein
MFLQDSWFELALLLPTKKLTDPVLSHLDTNTSKHISMSISRNKIDSLVIIIF